MIYIYDILLNWNKNKLYDFYEWEKTDKLEHIKKIPLIRVNKGVIPNFYYNNIIIKGEVLDNIYNATESYSLKKVNKVPYAFVITDGSTALALKCDKSGKVIEKSKFIIDEEEEILCFTSRLKVYDIQYEIKEKTDNVSFLTRKEVKIKDFLLKEINDCYKQKDSDKLKYLYTECFGNVKDNIYDMYNELVSSLNKEITKSHQNLYGLLHLIVNKS